MGSLSQAETAELKAQLQDAVTCCSDRGLHQAAKWYVEQRPHGSRLC